MKEIVRKAIKQAPLIVALVLLATTMTGCVAYGITPIFQGQKVASPTN